MIDNTNIIDKPPAVETLPDPFSAEEWYSLSLCIGWTALMSDEKPTRMSAKTFDVYQRRQAAIMAMAAMRRILGDTYHARIAAVFPCVKSN